MITVKQAAEKAMNLGKQFQAVIEVGECLDKIGNLETATQEAQAAIDAAVNERAVVEDTLSQTQVQLQKAQQNLSETKNKAITILDDVNISRDRLFAQAKAERDKSIQAATSEANKLTEVAAGAIQKLTTQHKNLLKEVEDVTHSLQNLRYEMRELRERLDG